MTRNEYIASIMLEAASLLREDNEVLTEGILDKFKKKKEESIDDFLSETVSSNNKNDYTSQEPNNLFLYQPGKLNKFPKSKKIIFGDFHEPVSLVKKYFEEMIRLNHPEYIISEMCGNDICLTKNELKDKIDNAVDKWYYTDKKNLVSKSFNLWVYELAYKYDLKLIGCDTCGFPKTKQFKTMNEDFLKREKIQLECLKKYKNESFIVQIGDSHLRSVAWDKEFLDFIDQYDPEYVVDESSVIWKYFINKKDVLICRIKDEYDYEIKYKNHSS